MTRWLYLLSFLTPLVACACVPDFPKRLLSDPAVLEHPAVLVAFEQVKKKLASTYINSTRDSISFAIAHASTPEIVFAYNNGVLKTNETNILHDCQNRVTSDSIFRIMSVSKNFAMASALVVSQHPNVARFQSLSLDTPVRIVLPAFTLPERDWNDGGSELTLAMLASHTAGIPRESYSTGFNMILSNGKADAPTIGSAWAGVTSQDVLDAIAKEKLMFAPGQRAAYSNAGISILGSAVAAFYNTVTSSNLSWSQIVTEILLQPLGMTHSFFGPPPKTLRSFIGIPGGDHWADLVIGEGYNPAAGMWSSANDLAKYLHEVWLSPTPSLISEYQRRRSLRPVAVLPDGKQQVGPGWEIQLLTFNTSQDASVDSAKSYGIFGKSGDGGGWHSWIDVIPNLGYGVVILTQQSGQAGYEPLSPTRIRDIVHEILAPAFSAALAERSRERYAGTYMDPRDTGLLSDTVNSSSTNTTSYAKLEVEDQILYIRRLVVNGSSALEAVDRLSWTSDTGPRYFSTEKGVALEPAEGAAEAAEFGRGAQVWRMIFPGLKECDWFDFDGYKDTRGWPLSKVVLVEKEEGVELRYPPFDVVFTSR